MIESSDDCKKFKANCKALYTKHIDCQVKLNKLRKKHEEELEEAEKELGLSKKDIETFISKLSFTYMFAFTRKMQWFDPDKTDGKTEFDKLVNYIYAGDSGWDAFIYFLDENRGNDEDEVVNEEDCN